MLSLNRHFSLSYMLNNYHFGDAKPQFHQGLSSFLVQISQLMFLHTFTYLFAPMFMQLTLPALQFPIFLHLSLCTYHFACTLVPYLISPILINLSLCLHFSYLLSCTYVYAPITLPALQLPTFLHLMFCTYHFAGNCVVPASILRISQLTILTSMSLLKSYTKSIKLSTLRQCCKPPSLFPYKKMTEGPATLQILKNESTLSDIQG